MKKTFALLIVFVLVFSLAVPSFVFAADKGGSGNGKSQVTEPGNGKDKVEKPDTTKTTADTDTNSTDSSKTAKKEQLKGLKDKYTEAVQAKDDVQKAAVKQQIKDMLLQLRQEVKSTYTTEETANLEKVAKELKKAHPEITTMPVESFVALGKNMKFDTPPVIKEGRMLVPVRALSSAFGADVQYDQATKQITIVKDGTTLVLKLDSKTVLVNGVETQLDVPAESLNGRTVVPLRFIAEKLGLKVDYDDDTDTVTVDDGDEDTDTGNTSTGGDSNTSTDTNAGTSTNTTTTTTTSDTTTTTTTTDTGTNTQTSTGTTTTTTPGTDTSAPANGQ